jgi:L-threonylcarbamoyladenylate synthase
MRQESETRLLAADTEAIRAAGQLLREGALVAFPTETVYGLGADATSNTAVARIYAAKGRPSFNPLIAHVVSLEAARHEGVFNADAEILAKAFWPGPLTLVVPVAASGRVCDLARAGLDSVALRVPAHPVALALLAAADRPVAAPSANISGHISPTRADHVANDLRGKVDVILDGGPTSVGVESTIVACLPEGTRVLRPGGVATEDIYRALGREAPPQPARGANDGDVIAPGMLVSHYAPRAAVRLFAYDVAPDEAALDFCGRLAGFNSKSRIDLSPTGDLEEAASKLFGALRALDASGAMRIAAAPIPMDGLGEAINDRLHRAAAERG